MKKQKFIPIILFILSIILVMLNHYAGVYFLYWRFWWFDIVMHFLGGSIISLLSIYIYKSFFGDFNDRRSIIVISFSLVFVFIVAIFWEVFEFFMDSNIKEANYFLDTITDILMAILGTLFTYNFFIGYNKKK